MIAKPRIRFSAIGLNHDHIYGQVNLLQNSGGELVSFIADEDDLAGRFEKAYPQARRARNADEIFGDESIDLIASAAIPDQRAGLAVQAMRHGKDFFSDKPGMTTLEQLAEVRRVQAETRRIYSVFYAERLENAATFKAGELVRGGAIGKVIQTIGLGPHRINAKGRPAWFFEREKYGGILTDIGSHQIDQFLFFTDSYSAEIVTSQVANYHHPEYPELEDFGDALLRNNDATGYLRVDWFTPDGLGVFGDARLLVLGTDGYIEVRKYCDLAGRPGSDHIFLVDHRQQRHFDCSGVELPFGRQLVEDVVERTSNAMSQEHTFLVMELALEAQNKAEHLRRLDPGKKRLEHTGAGIDIMRSRR